MWYKLNNKIITAGIIFLFIGLALAPSINANITKESNNNKEKKTDNLSPQLGYQFYNGFRSPGINLYVINGGNDTFRGNVSCIFTVNASIMIFGDSINISDYYVEIEPGKEELLYKGLILGFGTIEAVLYMPPPVDIYEEFEGFLLFIFLFMNFKFP